MSASRRQWMFALGAASILMAGGARPNGAAGLPPSHEASADRRSLGVGGRADSTLRDAALAAIDNDVRWIPSWGRDRIYNMVAGRPDWCISRQRAWGVPIPAVDCTACGTAVLTTQLIARAADVFERHNADAWYEHPIEEFLPAGLTCPSCGGRSFEREKDILDVWFDSGSSHEAVLARTEELGWPADLYLEGSDQHRGWFQSSLLVGLGTRGRAPYHEVVTNGFVVAEDGRKMSKSLGNSIEPQDIIKDSGADILRLWVAMSDYTQEVRLSKEILARAVEAYRKIRNTCRYLLANLYDFNPQTDTVAPGEMLEIDVVLPQMIREAEAANEAKSAFLATMSHEIRITAGQGGRPHPDRPRLSRFRAGSHSPYADCSHLFRRKFETCKAKLCLKSSIASEYAFRQIRAYRGQSFWFPCLLITTKQVLPFPQMHADSPVEPVPARKYTKCHGTGLRNSLILYLEDTDRNSDMEGHTKKWDIVAMASSAGGLTALSHILADLPPDFPAPIVVVQHLDPRHRSLMAKILSRRTSLKVKEAEEGDVVSPGTVYIAKPDRHLLVNSDHTLSLSQSELVHFVRPSADLLFESVAASFKDRAIAVVLTGSGIDGAMGVKAIKMMGGTVIVQDKETSQFFGMPGAAIQTEMVDFILPLGEISAALVTLLVKGEAE